MLHYLNMLRELGLLKWITHYFTYFAFGLAGAIMQLLLMKINKEVVTWSLVALVIISAITFSMLLGAALESHLPASVIGILQTLVGFTGKSVLDYINKRFSPRNTGETLRAIFELMLNMWFPKK